MFTEFEQGAKKLQDCFEDCTRKYRLQARYYTHKSYSVCSIESAVIVTSMNRFYQRVNISAVIGDSYQGTVFVGVSFRDQTDITVTSNQKLYKKNWGGDVTLESTSSLTVCGTETDTSTGWISVGGPIKGSYVVKDGQNSIYDFISDFGFYVEDPCQAFDN